MNVAPTPNNARYPTISRLGAGIDARRSVECTGERRQVSVPTKTPAPKSGGERTFDLVIHPHADGAAHGSRQLVDMRKAEKLHRHSAGQDEIATAIDAMIELLARQIGDLDRRIADLIHADQTLADQARLLAAVLGIGPTVLATLLGELPVFGTLCRRRIASLAGLAPHARESGTWRGARRIWGGRRKVHEAP